MKWSELTPEHNGRWARISTNQPGQPRMGFEGYLEIKEGHLPLLNVKNEKHSFARYWDVTFLSETPNENRS